MEPPVLPKLGELWHATVDGVPDVVYLSMTPSAASNARGWCYRRKADHKGIKGKVELISPVDTLTGRSGYDHHRKG